MERIPSRRRPHAFGGDARARLAALIARQGVEGAETIGEDDVPLIGLRRLPVILDARKPTARRLSPLRRS